MFGITPADLGLAAPQSWLTTLALGVGWFAVMLLYTPVADCIATRFFAKAPTLRAFGVLQESRGRLVAGIAIAWILGAFLEELVLRGIVLRAIEIFLAASIADLAAITVAILSAAAGAFFIHLYQGLRAAFIVAQLSVLFGILFVISGYTLWAVILCHGLYDTVAFIRFAHKASKYSDLDD